MFCKCLGGVLFIPPRVLDDRQCFTARSARRKKKDSTQKQATPQREWRPIWFRRHQRLHLEAGQFALLQVRMRGTLRWLTHVHLDCKAGGTLRAARQSLQDCRFDNYCCSRQIEEVSLPPRREGVYCWVPMEHREACTEDHNQLSTFQLAY